MDINSVKFKGLLSKKEMLYTKGGDGEDIDILIPPETKKKKDDTNESDSSSDNIQSLILIDSNTTLIGLDD